MANKTNELVVKDNRLVEASYHLDLIEQRIILLAIVEARKQQKTITAKDFIYVHAKDYAETYNIPMNKAYEALIDAANKLYDRSVRIQLDDSAKLNLIDIRWLSAKGVHTGTGTLGLRFTQDVIPLITRLEKQFTRYQLGQIAGMTSAHAIRLYELLIQWGSIGKREIELEWLKKTLMLEDQYSAIKDFKKYVIDVAVKQINEYSDLTVSYTQRKTGRNVTHITFACDKKPAKVAPLTPPLPATPPPTVSTEVDGECFAAATVKITQANQNKLLKIRTPDEIRQCIEIANQNIKDVTSKGGKINNLAAYYATAIRDGWHLEKQEEQEIKEKQQRDKDKLAELMQERERVGMLQTIDMLNAYNREKGLPLIKPPEWCTSRVSNLST